VVHVGEAVAAGLSAGGRGNWRKRRSARGPLVENAGLVPLDRHGGSTRTGACQGAVNTEEADVKAGSMAGTLLRSDTPPAGRFRVRRHREMTRRRYRGQALR